MRLRTVLGTAAVTVGAGLVAVAPGIAFASGHSVTPNSSVTKVTTPKVPVSIPPVVPHHQLPFTGIDIAEVAGAGILLVGAGGVLLAVRRRTVA